MVVSEFCYYINYTTSSQVSTANW